MSVVRGGPYRVVIADPFGLEDALNAAWAEAEGWRLHSVTSLTVGRVLAVLVPTVPGGVRSR